MEANNEPSKKSHGTRNLYILGIGSILITLITTALSIYIYHTSGDIYLDRSRPGYLPDKSEETSKDNTTSYSFDENSEVNKKNLTEYLTNLDKEVNNIKDIDAFNDEPLSDDSLGISTLAAPESN